MGKTSRTKQCTELIKQVTYKKESEENDTGSINSDKGETR